MHGSTLSRRDILGSLAAAGGALALGGGGAFGQDAGRKRAVRLAHMTDSHIQPERGAFDGVAACLTHAMGLADRPELVVTGGDLIMDGFEQPRERTAAQWDLFRRAFRDHCGVPVVHTLGNHDVWGWNQKKSKTTSDEPQWGKQWALDALELSAPYRSVERGNWTIIVLDSVFPDRGDGYIGKLDEAQMAWLDSTLGAVAAAGRHAMIVSHIPIMSVTVFDLDSRVEENEWRMSGGVMHVDAQALLGLFRTHRCVRLAVSGHIHKLDRCDFEGVSYICDGAVSGSWWRGPGKRCPEGYGVFDLYDDGSFEHSYMTYGWSPRE
ncbi:MAG: metallophosphoesterase [Planctomycetota bacterium]|nr:metallophosphoesterase [Planctomycetota bacterium]